MNLRKLNQLLESNYSSNNEDQLINNELQDEDELIDFDINHDEVRKLISHISEDRAFLSIANRVLEYIVAFRGKHPEFKGDHYIEGIENLMLICLNVY